MSTLYYLLTYLLYTVRVYLRAFAPRGSGRAVVASGIMLALAQLALSLSPPARKPAVAGKQFHRVTDVLQLSESTSAVDVVNVLGRRDTYAQVHRVAQRAA